MNLFRRHWILDRWDILSCYTKIYKWGMFVVDECVVGWEKQKQIRVSWCQEMLVK